MNESRTAIHRVRTPEGVSFAFRLASPALRGAALFIDVCVVFAAWSALSFAFYFLRAVSVDIAQAVALVAFFLLSQGYRIASEWLWRGQTVGKRVLHLRVVDQQGLRLSFSQIVLRNLLRFVDTLPAGYLVGGAAALLNRRGQRLGDLAAGTLVIWEVTETAPDPTLFREAKYNTLRSHPPLMARLRQAVTPREAEAAWQALARRDSLEPEARVRLFSELAEHFRSLTPIPEEVREGVSDEQFVRNVVEVLYLSQR